MSLNWFKKKRPKKRKCKLPWPDMDRGGSPTFQQMKLDERPISGQKDSQRDSLRQIGDILDGIKALQRPNARYSAIE